MAASPGGFGLRAANRSVEGSQETRPIDPLQDSVPAQGIDSVYQETLTWVTHKQVEVKLENRDCIYGVASYKSAERVA